MYASRCPRPGAKAHEWFAFVKPASHHVGFFLLPISEFPELRAGLSRPSASD